MTKRLSDLLVAAETGALRDGSDTSLAALVKEVRSFVAARVCACGGEKYSKPERCQRCEIERMSCGTATLFCGDDGTAFGGGK